VRIRNFCAGLVFASLIALALISPANPLEFFQPTSVNPTPRLASAPNNAITVDVTNGDSFAGDTICCINWTVSGFAGLQYVLEDNDVVTGFGFISSNESYHISQYFNLTNGWHAFSIHVRNQTDVVQDSYVVVEIKVDTPIFQQNGFWISLAAGIASIAVVSELLMWRKMRRSSSSNRNSRSFQEGKGRSFANNSQFSAKFQGTDLLPTQSQNEEDEFYYLSTTRVEKYWIFDLEMQQIIASTLFREQLWEQKREEVIDQELFAFLIQNAASLSLIKTPTFVTIASLQDNERLLAVNFGNTHVLVFLLHGRITRSYFDAVADACHELAFNLDHGVHFDAIPIFDILETHLKLSRSLPYLKGGLESEQVLRNTLVPELVANEEIIQDAHILTPEECTWIVQRVSQIKTLTNSDSLLDEVEHV